MRASFGIVTGGTDMSELKPCPFCGGEAKFQLFNTTCNIECTRCFIGTRLVAHDDYKQAIKAWNIRAERTCSNVDEGGDFECSVCGFVWVLHPHYCPNCGAKVISENASFR